MRADAQANQRELLKASWELVAQHGADVSLRAVAERAGVGIATLYRHFPTRGDLLDGLAVEANTRISEVVGRHLDDWDADPSGTWRAFVTDLASLRIGALAAQMPPRTTLDAAASDTRTAVLDTIELVLAKARDARIIAADITALRFCAGLATATRPLPGIVATMLPDQEQWMLETFTHGIEPRD